MDQEPQGTPPLDRLGASRHPLEPVFVCAAYLFSLGCVFDSCVMGIALLVY